jgi:hypothetical protein
VKRRILAITACAALLALAPVAEARPSSSGYVTEAGIGATAFIGPNAGYSAIGPGFHLRVGYDLFSWFTVGGHLGASTHQATVPPPPEGEYYQLYTAAADARLSASAGRFGLFVDGGLGLAYISSNVLGKVGILDPGQRVTVQFEAGGGIEYQLQNRHYAFGLAGQWFLLPEFDATQGVATRLYLRYTY